MNTTALLLAQTGALRAAREALIAIADELQEERRRINDDPYLAREERELAHKRAIAEAKAKLAPRLRRARERVDEHNDVVRRVLEQSEPGEQATAQVRRLLDQGVPPGDVLNRARGLGERETLIALRNELKWRTVPGRYGGAELQEAEKLERLVHGASLAIAELTPGDEGKALLEAVKTSIKSGVDEAARFATRATSTRGADGDAGVASLLEYAYATGPAGATSLADRGDEGGEGGGEGGE